MSHAPCEVRDDLINLRMRWIIVGPSRKVSKETKTERPTEDQLNFKRENCADYAMNGQKLHMT